MRIITNKSLFAPYGEVWVAPTLLNLPKNLAMNNQHKNKNISRHEKLLEIMVLSIRAKLSVSWLLLLLLSKARFFSYWLNKRHI